jgi:hypothetical protein
MLISQVDMWLREYLLFEIEVPKKIRELKAMLRKAGFSSRPGKGSHTFGYIPPCLTGLRSQVQMVTMLNAIRKLRYGTF